MIAVKGVTVMGQCVTCGRPVEVSNAVSGECESCRLARFLPGDYSLDIETYLFDPIWGHSNRVQAQAPLTGIEMLDLPGPVRYSRQAPLMQPGQLRAMVSRETRLGAGRPL